MIIIRLRSSLGQFRVEIDQSEPIKNLKAKIQTLVGKQVKSLSTQENNGGNLILFENLEEPIQSLKLQNGALLYFTPAATAQEKGKLCSTSSNHVSENGFSNSINSKGNLPRSYIKQDPLDDWLLKQPGTIKRPRNPQFCKHGDQGMCEYCLPLQPYDQSYLDENKIKHKSFHAHLRQLMENNKTPPRHSPLFIPPLDIPSYKILSPCPAGTHAPYPTGICSKCQPSPITLQTQNFRMVDHVEFSSPNIIENFLSFWRTSGVQRAGYMYGKYEAYDKVPLGVKAVVECIYECQQSGGADFVQLDMQSDTSPIGVAAQGLTRQLGLVRLGIIYTDLLDDGTGKGTVICKRHSDSYFMSSAEIIFTAKMQHQFPVKSVYSPTGEFGSRFITVVVTGNEEGNIDIQTYQVSNSAVSMTNDGIVEASTNPGLMRISNSTADKYVPDVFFKYKNEYNIMVQEAANPTFPVEYLLITASHGFPSISNPLFPAIHNDLIENRFPFPGRTMSELKKVLSGKSVSEQTVALSDFHLLLYIAEMGILDGPTLKLICTGVMTKKEQDIQLLVDSPGWATFQMIFKETPLLGPNNNSGNTKNDPWSCKHCTFTNMGGDSCEMCGLPNE